MQWILIQLAVLAAHGTADCLDEQRNIFLWSVDLPNGSPAGYLFGTIHVPYTKIWDKVSDRVKEAFNRSDSVIVEVDLQDQTTLRRLMKCKNLRRRHTSVNYLGSELRQRILDYFAAYRKKLNALAPQREEIYGNTLKRMISNFNSVVSGWDRKRPEWLLFVLYQLCENNLERDEAPMLDAYLAEHADLRGKPIFSVETAEEQCNPVSSLSQEQLVFAINYTLAYLEHQLEQKRNPSLPNARNKRTHDLVRSYECGSLDTEVFKNTQHNDSGFNVNMESLQKAREVDQLLKSDILLSRNVRMASRLDRIFTENAERTFFAALGTGHFIGEKNVLELLTAKGYKIRPVKDGDQILSRRNTTFNSLWVRGSTEVQQPIEVSIEIITSDSPSFKSCFLFVLFVLLRF